MDITVTDKFYVEIKPVRAEPDGTQKFLVDTAEEARQLGKHLADAPWITTEDHGTIWIEVVSVINERTDSLGPLKGHVHRATLDKYARWGARPQLARVSGMATDAVSDPIESLSL